MSASDPVIVTERLLLREFRGEDAPALFQLNSDPDVMRYTGDRPFDNIKDAANFIGNYPDYRVNGFGRWAVVGRESGRFLGFCGLKLSISGEVDVGFRLFRHAWARGIATEAADACLRWGFEVQGLERIVGRAMRENLPSISVLQKLGMNFREISEEAGLIWLIYQITKTEFDSRS